MMGCGLMKTINELDKQIQNLILKKRDLIIQQDKGEISDKVYEATIKFINLEHSKLNKIKISQLNSKIESRNKPPDIKPVKQKRDVKTIIGNNVNVNSYTSLIIKALKHKAVDTEDKVIAVVNEWRPGTHKEKIRNQVKNIISLIKKREQSRFKQYEWNEKTYEVIESCQSKLF